MSSASPKISIVIPSYNQGQFIAETIESITSQNYPDLELIIVDGASTDGTADVLAALRDRIDVLISEKDDGQSDALIKGFSRATGDIWTWLSSDDLLLPGALREAAELFERDPGLEWVLGNVIWVDPTLCIMQCRKGGRHVPYLTAHGMFSAMGPSSFFTPGLYARCGGVDRNLHYMMDTDLWWKFLTSGATFARLKNYTWALRLHPAAKMSGHHFSGSEFADQEHPAHKRKRNEERIIKSRNPALTRPRQGWWRTLDRLHRALTPRYVKSLFDSVRYRGKALKGSPLLQAETASR